MGLNGHQKHLDYWHQSGEEEEEVPILDEKYSVMTRGSGRTSYWFSPR